jgi:hypothetical protein
LHLLLTLLPLPTLLPLAPTLMLVKNLRTGDDDDVAVTSRSPELRGLTGISSRLLVVTLHALNSLLPSCRSQGMNFINSFRP